jgi:G:T-mismatch repair DNA endonuclease (very short patch repair protein)
MWFLRPIRSSGSKKISANVERDGKTYLKLKSAGWRVAVIWECEIERDPEQVYKKITELIT